MSLRTSSARPRECDASVRHSPLAMSPETFRAPGHRLIDQVANLLEWFHVDGVYGGFAASVPGAQGALRGLTAADSIAIDPHKWLYAPLEAGCALVRRPDALRAALAYHPP